MAVSAEKTMKTTVRHRSETKASGIFFRTLLQFRKTKEIQGVRGFSGDHVFVDKEVTDLYNN